MNSSPKKSRGLAALFPTHWKLLIIIGFYQLVNSKVWFPTPLAISPLRRSTCDCAAVHARRSGTDIYKKYENIKCENSCVAVRKSCPQVLPRAEAEALESG